MVQLVIAHGHKIQACSYLFFAIPARGKSEQADKPVVLNLRFLTHKMKPA